MSFFPAGYDYSDHVRAALDLCEIDTTDGPARFIVGVDGIFRDINGNSWYGSQLASVTSLASALEGQAPEGSATLSFFQDPDADSLIAQIKALGLDYIRGRAITFYVQPINSQSEFYAPTVAPVQWMQRVMRSLVFSASGAQDRSISVTFEAWSENRRAARRIVLNTEGHAKLIGEANPSLEFMPTSDFEEEKLFG
ncbi:hypothetical protein [Phaeobacter sp. 22II1-1F12B]|uniref:hypothetical protein n=1 Tax=Phaeobacter sp. 22II1-1F12B TaxID=1317111 RepID=UPI000B51F33C|nr:hypothetical protein [Phaeobacter sp. 22II1-1F12B]OWU80430.1 hypothetical protein ATO1_08745 [Phaeobacter sp. 22II1-1F12B]